MYDLSHVRLERRDDAVNGTYSYSSLSDQLQASGKGLTNEQAQASASMEFAERYSWLHFDYPEYEGYQVGSYEEILKGETPTVAPEYFLENFINLKKRNELTREIGAIPLKWIKGDSLTSGKKFYYPINWHNMAIGSNGLAAGNSLEEAIIQALCEVIERENLFKFFVEKKAAKNLDQDSIESPLVREVLTNSRARGINFTIKDISFDFKATTFIVRGIAESEKGKLAYKGVGQGTATSPEKALIRSLAEYFESYSLTKKKEMEFKEKIGEDISKYYEQLPRRHMGFFAFFNPEMLDLDCGTIKIQDLKDHGHNDIKEEIEDEIEDLRRKQLNLVVIDKTHPQLKIPAVRVFVPGMRNMINCEIESPNIALAEVYYEARDYERSQKYFDLAMGATREIRDITAGISVKKVMKKDYLQNLIQLMGTKKSSIDTLKDMLEMIKKLKGTA